MAPICIYCDEEMVWDYIDEIWFCAYCKATLEAEDETISLLSDNSYNVG